MTKLPTMDRRGWLALWAQDRRRLRRTWLAPQITSLWLEYGATWMGSWDIRGTFDFKLGDRSASDMEIWVKRTGVDADFYLFGTFIISSNTFRLPHLIVDPPDFTPFNVEVKLRYNNYYEPPGQFSAVREVSNQRAFAPALSPVYPDKLGWDWPYPNPYRWNVWVSWDGGETWVHPEDYWTTGSARDFWPDGGSSLHYVVGVDADGNEITARSNAVRPDDATMPVTLRTDLAAYWKLEETSGQGRADATGNGWTLWDWSANDDPYLIGQVTGLLGSAAVFADEHDNGLAVSGFTGWNVNGPFTLAGWFFYMANLYDHETVAAWADGFTVAINTYGYALELVWTDAAGTHQIASESWSVLEATWYHFAVVREAGALKLYLNGSLAASAPLTLPPLAGDPFLLLGCSPSGQALLGPLDEFACWNRALAAGEVDQLYNAGLGLAYENF